MKLKDSQTFTNLARAFAAECAARTRYEFCEYGFRMNGYEAIASLIDKIAYQEFNHARMLYMKLQHSEIKQIDNIDCCVGLPFKEIADLFAMIRDVEIRHSKIFQEVHNQMKDKKLYKRAKEVAWICPACGYVSFGIQAWETCPLCQAKQGYCSLVLPDELHF